MNAVYAVEAELVRLIQNVRHRAGGQINFVTMATTIVDVDGYVFT